MKAWTQYCRKLAVHARGYSIGSPIKMATEEASAAHASQSLPAISVSRTF